MTAIMLFAAFLMGLTGSLHCAGMCGPIMWVMPFQQYEGLKRGIGIALYHAGRITVYALLGAMLHTYKGLFHPQWQQYWSMSAGAILLILGLMSFLPQGRVGIRLPWAGAVAKGLALVMQRRHPIWLAAAGALNGLLPCGMVYIAMAAAISVPHTTEAAWLMYAFGLGTTPMMVAISLLRTKGPLRAVSFTKWTPVVILLFGCFFILRGANLGIPLLSPKIISAQEVHMECCHRVR